MDDSRGEPRRVLLTGAGSGIGAHLAGLLQARGDALLLLARTHARGAELVEQFPGSEVIVADLADEGALDTVTVTGPLDAVVHAAGVVEVGTLAETDPIAVRDQIQVNLVAPMLLTRAALPALRERRGTVVFVNSTAALQANPGWASYAASKAGLVAAADALRAEERAHGVRISTIYPGRTATPMQEKVHAAEGADYDAERWIRPESVAGAILSVLDLPEDATVSDLTLRPHRS